MKDSCNSNNRSSNSNSNSNRSSRNNNYSPKKFIGGAERARRKAQQFFKQNNVELEIRKRKSHNNNNNSSSSKQHTNNNQNIRRLSKRIKPSERFYASLLQHDIHSILESDVDDSSWRSFMMQTCEQALGIPLPKDLPETFKDGNDYYTSLSSLVIEESRSILINALMNGNSCNNRIGNGCHKKRKMNGQGQYPFNGGYALDLMHVEQSEKTGFLTMNFVRHSSSIRKQNTFRSLSSPSFIDKDNDGANSRTFVPFTPKELYDMKPGCIFKVTMYDFDNTNEEDDYEHDERTFDSSTSSTSSTISFLASVIPFHNKSIQSNDRYSTLPLMMYNTKLKYFHTILDLTKTKRWYVSPVTTLISEQRQFEACMKAPKLCFMHKLLRMKTSTHIRFDSSSSSSDDDDEDDNDEDELLLSYDKESVHAYHKRSLDECTLREQDIYKQVYNNEDEDRELCTDTEYKDSFCDSKIMLDNQSILIPRLNTTQRKAADAFLRSSDSTITLVQGPPGTGKTTFTVSVLCQSLFEICDESGSYVLNNDKRILVTAPSNKAITVLASRFIKALNGYNDLNMVLIGVEEKLVSDDMNDDEAACLKNIFVYTWLDKIEERYKSLECIIKSKIYTELSDDENHFVVTEARAILKKLKQSIPYTGKKAGLVDLAEEFYFQVNNRHLSQLPNLLSKVFDLLQGVKDSDVVDELLATANVIFCTLSSSGVSAIKRTRQINDLFIDEAAACCEAETAIPFHLRPNRLLMVGDPMQLPATLISRKAMEFGYDRSLLERLMGDEKQHVVMLDVQYRMKPAISSFPSSRFYNNKLHNGDEVRERHYCNGFSLDSKMLSNYTFLDVRGTEQRNFNGSYYNEAEAKEITQIVQKIKYISKGSDWCSSAKLRIITFYQGQTACIRKFLKQSGNGQVMVATVDSSQGSEADVVIISFVRSGSVRRSNNSRAGFLKDDRRINVALTRAKFHLVCVGDATFLQSCGLPTLKAMIQDSKTRNIIRTNCDPSKTPLETEGLSALTVLPSKTVYESRNSNKCMKKKPRPTNAELQTNTGEEDDYPGKPKRGLHHNVNQTNVSDLRTNNKDCYLNQAVSKTIKSSALGVQKKAHLQPNNIDDIQSNTACEQDNQSEEESEAVSKINYMHSNPSTTHDIETMKSSTCEQNVGLVSTETMPTSITSCASKNKSKSSSSEEVINAESEMRKCKMKRLQSLKQQLPFMQTDLQVKKRLRLEISKLEKVLLN